MEKAIIGKKIGMTQIFDEAGRVVPVTVIQAGPCTVVQKKTAEKDGYEAIQLGYQTVPERKLTKPELGHQKKAGLEELKKVLKEFALNDCSKFEVGDQLTANIFAAGDFVDVTGISKGHGFQGVVKRHGAAIKRMTHGGIVFAPKPRDYSYTLNKKVKRLALKSALSAKAAQGAVLVVDGLKLEEIKTKAMKETLNSIGASKSVVITPEVDQIVVKSARNIPGVVTTTAKILSVYDIVNAKQLVIDKAALAIIEEVYA